MWTVLRQDGRVGAHHGWALSPPSEPKNQGEAGETGWLR